jgi:hypothetical protein
MARVTAAILSQALHLCHYTHSYDVSQAATPPAAEVGGKGTESTISYSVASRSFSIPFSSHFGTDWFYISLHPQAAADCDRCAVL